MQATLVQVQSSYKLLIAVLCVTVWVLFALCGSLQQITCIILAAKNTHPHPHFALPQRPVSSDELAHCLSQ